MNRKKTPEEIETEHASHKKFAKGKASSMHRRCDVHDYKDKATYMFTICLKERRPLFGQLVVPQAFSASFDRKSAGHEVQPTSPVGHPTVMGLMEALPYILLSPVGEIIKEKWEEIPLEYNQIDNIALQIMPDHIHGMLQVRASLPMPIGKIIGRFKFLTTKKYNQMIQDNPRRLAMKMLRKDFFSVRKAELAGYHFSYLGNYNLLKGKLVQLQCSRSMDGSDIENEKARSLQRAMEGYVFVSPCISAGEKAVTRHLFDAGFPLVVLLENGFAEYYKPPAAFMEACAMGRILFLAPWEHHNEKRAITCAQCLALNQMAADICRCCGQH